MNREVYGKLIFELSRPGSRGTRPVSDGAAFPKAELPANLTRSAAPALPELSEPEVVRHYTRMSTNNFGVDTGFYPLGSCTMKYNPKINDALSALPAMARLHPLAPDSDCQGALRAYWELQRSLSEIGGMAEFTLNPYAGAHGELTGLMIIRAWHDERCDKKRTKVIVPNSAHGTNPASAAVCGLEVVEVASLPDGTVDVEALRPLLDDTVAAMMMTNPNTLGIFESSIPEIAKMVHDCGALMYYDGANLNPMLGVARPGDMGFDVMHINLHKTFSTPHGGGGPGSGPVGVRAGMEHLLPAPRVVKQEDTDTFSVMREDPGSCGSVSPTLGNFGVELRALAYILTMGRDGLAMAGPLATLNANYVKESLRDVYKLPVDRVCKHEFVFDGLADKSTGVTTLDVAKRLLDYGYHAPTIYFPLLFHESLMIEPTETESRETLDEFIDVMRRIAAEALSDPDTLKAAPVNTPVGRPDDTKAALEPIVRFTK